LREPRAELGRLRSGVLPQCPDRRLPLRYGYDCIAIKSGRNADGLRLSRPCENVVIADCEMRAGHGGVIEHLRYRNISVGQVQDAIVINGAPYAAPAR
jgi:hypothetical protein